MNEPRSNSGAIIGGIPQNQFGEDLPNINPTDPRAQAIFDAQWQADQLAGRKMQKEAIAREQMAAMQKQQPALQSLLSGMTELPQHLQQLLQQGFVEGGRAMMVPDNRSVHDLKAEEYGPYFQRQLGQAGLRLDQEKYKNESRRKEHERWMEEAKRFRAEVDDEEQRIFFGK